MNGKRLWLVVGLLSIVAIVIGGVQAAPTFAQGTGKTLNFCVVHNNADHPSITAIVRGMQDEAKYYNVKLTFFDPAYDPQKQLSMINDCIALKPDVILVNAVDPAAVVPGLKKIYDAKIPLIMHNADTNDEGRKYSKTFVSVDLTEQGRAAGRAMVSTLPQGSRGVVILGHPGQSGVKERLDGAVEVLKASGKDIQFVDQQPADWMKDKALTVMQDFLTKYPSGKINFLYGEDDQMAMGGLQAIKAAGRQKEFKVYGVGGFKEACDLIKTGEMVGTSLHPSYLVGVYSIRAGVDALLNRPLPKEIDAPTGDITAANIDQMYQFCW